MDIFPGLPRTQRNAIVARGYKRFGDMPWEDRDIEFSRILVGNLHVLTFRFWNGFVPSKPLHRDMMTALGGGYAQEHILVSVVKIVRKLPQDMLEIQLETPTMMSHRNGTTAYSDKFVIHKDGHVMYFNEGENEPRNWSSYIPKWEYTRYPVLPVVVEGLPEEEEQPPAAKEQPPAAKRTRKTL
jgi:hypothetical protein